MLPSSANMRAIQQEMMYENQHLAVLQQASHHLHTNTHCKKVAILYLALEL